MRLFKIFIITLAVSSVFLAGCKKKDPVSRYVYESVAGDPLKARIYTLPNGLKVYLSVNPREPRIQTYIAVKAGSKSDPKETTGLAHYLEHMVFKGTHQIGTLNWEKEKVLLDSISALYEMHKNTADPVQKKAIYHRIDSFSYEASKYAVPNEYDKMISSLGAKGTNAFTSVEQTVYINDIPTNELEKWLMVESERFRTLVLRLFHTELETVYEEFNRGQDSDGRKMWDALNAGLFPNHPYGTQTTLGEGEHLKNPSLVNIHNYFDQYYVPNNIAICLAGDLDPDKTMALIEKYFGDWKPSEVPPFTFDPQPELTQPVVKEVLGPQQEFVYLGYRFGGAASRDALLGQLAAAILFNERAGLIDLNINQKQKALEAAAYPIIRADFSALLFYGKPRQGQSLEQVKDLMLEQVELLKKGQFDDWMIAAAVKNLKLQQIKSFERNSPRADRFMEAFTMGIEWKNMVNELTDMESITKDEIMRFAQEQFKNNYVVAYKRMGEDTSVHKVEKPAITPVVMNRDTQSAFFSHFDSMQSPRIAPLFVDYKKSINVETLKNGIEVSYVKNDLNELFELYYIFDMGTDNERDLGVAIKYLPYLGTERYNAEELQKEFFKKGLSFDVSSSKDQVYVTLKGLEESFEEGIQLFEHVLSSAQPDTQALKDLVDGILKERSDAKTQKSTILNVAMVNYAKYGPQSSFTNILAESELRSLDARILVEKIKSLSGFKHRIFYYGRKDGDKVTPVIEKNHMVPMTLKDYPVARVFPENETTVSKVYFADYDMVQTEMVMISKGPSFKKELMPHANLFNEYFGGGLSSIVFQEIREQKALAYAAYSYFSTPRLKDESHYIIVYIGTQADKLPMAVDAMSGLMNNMPLVENQFEASKEAAQKIIESERIVGSTVFWNYESLRKRGLDHDIRQDVYEKIKTASPADIQAFFDENVKGKNYNYLVLGKRSMVDKQALEKLGPVEELKLETVFGY